MAANLEISLDVNQVIEHLEQHNSTVQAAANQASDPETILLSVKDYSIPHATVRSTKRRFVGVVRPVEILVHLLFHCISSHWKKIFVVSCVLAVLMDPLFLYIPIIKNDINFLGVDKGLKKIALVSRSITDFSYLVDIVVQCYTFETIWRSSILIDILALLPLPQILILYFGFVTNATGWMSLNTIKKVLMNSLVLLQYVPRTLRIYFSCKELEETHHGEIGLWIKGVLNFFLYMLSSHVLGALWYFFAIQKMTACWKFSCPNIPECKASVFDCDNNTRNSTLLNQLNGWCPTKPPNATKFDFGIFLGVLESNISGSENHPQKFSNCFWWGVQNLSSLGSNLKTSSDTGENLFAASVSIIGLLLFLYLIGNLQTYMQLNSARREAHSHKMKIERKLEEKGPEIESWLSVNSPFIPASSRNNVTSQIMRKVKQELEGNRYVDVEEILSILPSELQCYIQSFTTLSKLKTVSKLQNMDEMVLQEICKHLKPRSYTSNSYIIREKEPLEMMLLIMDGAVKVESTSNASASTVRERGDLCGEELVDWASDPLFPTILPFSIITVQAMNNVEARILTASDLHTVVSLFWQHFSESVFASPPDFVRFKRLGLGNLPQLRPTTLHIERV